MAGQTFIHRSLLCMTLVCCGVASIYVGLSQPSRENIEPKTNLLQKKSPDNSLPVDYISPLVVLPVPVVAGLTQPETVTVESNELPFFHQELEQISSQNVDPILSLIRTARDPAALSRAVIGSLHADTMRAERLELIRVLNEERIVDQASIARLARGELMDTAILPTNPEFDARSEAERLVSLFTIYESAISLMTLDQSVSQELLDKVLYRDLIDVLDQHPEVEVRELIIGRLKMHYPNLTDL